jgi:hypothetical protein
MMLFSQNFKTREPILELSLKIINIMNNFFRTLLAGWGAWKLGGGCLSTVLIFVVIYYLLGHC